MRQGGGETFDQRVVVHLPDPVRIHCLQLCRVETRCALVHVVDVEPPDHILGRHDLVVTMAPAEPSEVVAQRLGQDAHRAIGIRAERAVPLGQLRPVRAVDQRYVSPDRRVPAHRLVDDGLARRVGQMVVAPDDVSDGHVVVVDDDGEHVCRRSVGTKDDEVVEVRVREADLALYSVPDECVAIARRLDADDGGNARGCLGRILVPPTTVIAWRPPLCLRALAHLGQLVRRSEAAIGRAFGQQLFRDLPVALDARELADGLVVPVEAQPRQSIEDRRHGLVRVPLPVRILDAQQHLPAMTACVEPVEQSGSRATDMQEAGWRRREACYDIHGEPDGLSRYR